MYVGHMPGLLRGRSSGERMTPVLGLRQRDTVKSGRSRADSSVDARPGQTSAKKDKRVWQSVLMSNISPSDKSRATGQGAKDVATGDEEEWRVRKLIKVGKGEKPLPLGVQSRAAVWINEAVFISLWPASLPRAVSSIWKSNEMSIASLSGALSVSSYSQRWTVRLRYDSLVWHLRDCRELPLTEKKGGKKENERAESGGGTCFEEDDSFNRCNLPAIESNTPPALLPPLRLSLVLQDSSLRFNHRRRGRRKISYNLVQHVGLITCANYSLLNTHSVLNRPWIIAWGNKLWSFLDNLHLWC